MNRTRITDFLSGKSVFEMYQLYTDSQWFSESDMQIFQLNKLQKLLSHCYANVPYYHNIMNEYGIGITNIDSLNILDKFPILTKEIIQNNYQNFIPTNINSIPNVRISQTGGTTGNILFKRNDAWTRSSIWGSYKRFQDWMGVQESDKSLILMGGHVRKNWIKENLKSKIIDWLYNSISVDIYNASKETLELIIRILKSQNISNIRAYPQFIYFLAQNLKEQGLRFNMKSIATTAEPVMAEHRKLIRSIFNADVFDQYGCGEIGGIAYECNKHEGLHITDERVIVETNNNNELIITDLDNFSMPFIRYWNADQAIVTNEKCSCGRNSKIIKQIMGRTCDYILGTHGQYLHWAYFWHLFFDSNIAETRNLKKFQIIQLQNYNIQIRLVALQLSSSEFNFLIGDLKKRLGNINVELLYVSDIENTITGKYRPVISYLAK